MTLTKIGENFPVEANRVALASLVTSAFGQTEIDFGSTPVDSATFTVTVSGMTTSHKVLCQMAYAAPTGKDLDELEMDTLELKPVSGTGNFTLYARGLDGYVAGKFKINYAYK